MGIRKSNFSFLQITSFSDLFSHTNFYAHKFEFCDFSQIEFPLMRVHLITLGTN